MTPPPQTQPRHPGSGRLADKTAIITGGDSGIGRAVAEAFAAEGADVVIVYLQETEDAQSTKQAIEQIGRRCLAIAGDVRDQAFCQSAVSQALKDFGRLDVLVNNAAEQHPQEQGIKAITPQQLDRTFRTNVYGVFWMTQAALPHLDPGASIINTTSVTAYKGSPHLIDYASTKGAVVSLTYSLALELVSQNIRVNGVAPGPIWTPLIASTFSPEQVAKFGANTPMKRPGQPNEAAPAYVFLASDDSSYMTGQILHPNGGTIISG